MILTSKVYAQAATEKLPNGEVSELNDLISDFSLFYAVAIKSKLFRVLAARPNPYPAKKQLLDGILSKIDIGEEAKAIIEVITKQNDMALMPKIINVLKEIRVKKFNVEEGMVTSVTHLSENDKKRCMKLLEKISGHSIILKEKVDPKVLGGIVLKCGDTIMDASILKKITTIENLLKI
jgi:F-type H+-transporting ATPase subunit delta